jgi:hypothetical protein
MSSAIEMIAHCMHHQSAVDPPYCPRCGRRSVLAADGWYCADCLCLVEQRSCPVCVHRPGGRTGGGAHEEPGPPPQR